ncbi:MAG: MarR family transcriptional regulator [Onishia taeanensis]|uniref:MarR family transcriptional regulator n=1 Tax=Onishia taeanensis TaxID=284577 RepID=A0A328XPJ3_9GAMM|nr:MarR family transcriptional regulator [Halomonas taeanensis]RAR59464.1 MarR family transcriptional regulator [Halomonas taeanensis]
MTDHAADDDSLLTLDNQLCFALYSTQLAMNKLYRRLLNELGLTYPQYLVMLVLWQHGQLSVSKIGEHLGLDSATLTPLLKRLEAHGLVKRQRSSEDERRVDVSLSTAGEALKDRARDVPKAAICATHCEPQELGKLRDELNALRKKLEADG